MNRTIAIGIVVLFAACTCAMPGKAGEGTGTTEQETVREAERQLGEWDDAAAAEKDRQRTWLFSLFTGVQYDDNITLRGMRVETEGDDRTDWKLIHALQIEGRLVNTQEQVLGARYSLYQTFVQINDDVQLTGHTVGLYYTAMQAPYVFFLPVSYSRYNLYWHKYLDTFSVSPTVFCEQSAHAVGVLRATISANNFSSVPDNDFDEQDLDSTVVELEAEEWFLFGKDAEYRLEMGYRFRPEDAAVQEWTSVSSEVRLGLGAQLPWWGLAAGGFMSYEARDYQKRNEDFGRIQENDVLTYGLALSRPLWRDATISATCRFTDHESNVPSQEYERTQITLSVSVRF